MKWRVVKKSLPVEVVGSMRVIPKSCVDVAQVKLDLLIEEKQAWAAAKFTGQVGQIRRYPMYQETLTHIAVPRNYEVPYKTKVVTRDERGLEERLGDIQCSIAPRDAIQKDAIRTLCYGNDDKVIALSCGRGKTAVALMAAASTGRLPMLVVVHTNALADQWVERIKQFYGLPASAIGRVQGQDIDWEGKLVAVAMLQTLVNRPKAELTQAFRRYWRLVVMDEVHRMGAFVFSRVCSMFPAERWGLSATVQRDDGLDQVFRLHLGEVKYEDLTQVLVPEVFFLHSGVRLPESNASDSMKAAVLREGHRKFYMRNGDICLPRVLTWLSEHPARNEAILRSIEDAADGGRTILVLGERIKQMKELHKACQVESKGLHLGQHSKEERAEALTKQVVFASQQLAKEGLDRPSFDTLYILATFAGEGRLQQSIGRILRDCPSKKTPKVFIIVDDVGVCVAMSRIMRRWCFRQKYKVVDIQKDSWMPDESESTF